MIKLQANSKSNIELGTPSIVIREGSTVDLSNYYTKTEVDSLIPDTSGFALKSEIPDVSEFITEIPAEYVTETELNAKGYLTEHQSLEGYALKTDIPEGETVKHIGVNSAEELLELENGLYWLDKHVGINAEGSINYFSGLMVALDTTFIFLAYGTFVDYDIENNTWYCDSYAMCGDGFLTEEQVVALIPDVSEFIKEVPAEYITETELNNKGYLTEHQSLEDYSTTTQVQNMIDAAIAGVTDGEAVSY